MLEADPSLYRALFTLNRQRMHLIALALAHWASDVDAARGRLLLGGAPAPSFDALVAELGAIRQPAQMMTHLANLVRQLPLPEPIPPAVVGDARRLDSGTELRGLAKRWKNCLAGFYLDAVDNGRAAVY